MLSNTFARFKYNATKNGIYIFQNSTIEASPKTSTELSTADYMHTCILQHTVDLLSVELIACVHLKSVSQCNMRWSSLRILVTILQPSKTKSASFFFCESVIEYFLSHFMLRLFLSQLCLFWLLFHKADFKKKKARDRSSHDRIIGGQEAEHEE